MFKNYDRVDYSSKNTWQLKSQLQILILAFKNTLTVFQQENRHTKWSLPNKFNCEEAKIFLNNALSYFDNLKD